LFNYPADIRKAIYTTNAIESLNSVIRKAIKKRKLFPADDAAKKWFILRYNKPQKMESLALGTMPIRNWKTALNRFTPHKSGVEVIEFEDCLIDYV